MALTQSTILKQGTFCTLFVESILLTIALFVSALDIDGGGPVEFTVWIAMFIVMAVGAGWAMSFSRSGDANWSAGLVFALLSAIVFVPVVMALTARVLESLVAGAFAGSLTAGCVFGWVAGHATKSRAVRIQLFIASLVATFAAFAISYNAGGPGGGAFTQVIASLAWIGFGVVGLVWIWAVRARLLAERKRWNIICFRCGYDLRGNTSGICPECGTGRAA